MSAVDVKTRDETTEDSAKRSHRHLIIRVTETGKPAVNMRIPFGLVRMGLKFMPAAEKENLKAQGIDMDEILAGLTGDEEGPLVQVDEESKSVFISVE